MARVHAGEIVNVSVGYSIQAAERAGERDGIPIVRVTRWTPREISFVALPADTTVGVGRQIPDTENGGHEMPKDIERAAQAAMTGLSGLHTRDDGTGGTGSRPQSSLAMARAAEGGQGRAQGAGHEAAQTGGAGGQGTNDQGARASAQPGQGESGTGAAPAQARGGMDGEQMLRMERQRIAEIDAAAREFDLPDDMVQRARRDGTSLDAFHRQVLDHLRGQSGESTRARETMIGMSDGETRSFSIMNLVRYLVNPNDQAAQRAAGFEIEASRAAADRLGRDPGGVFIPPDVLMRGNFLRAQGTGTAGAGGALVETQHLAGSFIDLLRNRLALASAGVTILTGLRGNVSIPKMTAGTSHEWVDEGGAPTDTQATFANVTMTPHTVGVPVPITRRLLLQSDPSIEALIRAEILARVAIAIDKVALAGEASPAAPSGLRDVIAAGADIWAAAGAPTHAEIVALESAVAAENADIGSLAYIYNAQMSGRLKSTEISAGTAVFIEGTDGTVNGHRRIRSNQSGANDVYFGNWADLIIGMWSGLDLREDRATLASSDGLVLRAFQDVDVAIRRAESFHMGRNL
jgi:HK97 family phage major capsid protein